MKYGKSVPFSLSVDLKEVNIWQFDVTTQLIYWELTSRKKPHKPKLDYNGKSPQQPGLSSVLTLLWVDWMIRFPELPANWIIVW